MSFGENVAALVAQAESGLVGTAQWWSRTSLGNVAKIVNGYPFPSANFNTLSGSRVIRIRDIKNGETNTFYDGPSVDAPIVETGDLIVGMDGDFNCCLWPSEPALLNQRVCKIVVDNDLYEKKFLYFLLPGYLNIIHESTSSVTVKHLSSKTIGEIPLPLLSLSEQRRIVERIDELFSQIEAGEAALVRAKKLLARYRQAVLKAAVTGELTRDWRERHQAELEPATHLLTRILQARREAWEKTELEKLRAKGKEPRDDNWKQKYKEPEPPDTTNLPELPEGWVCTSIGQLFRVSVGATPDRANPRYWNGDIPWISSGEVRFSTIHSSRETISEAGLRNSSTHWLEIGTVLLAMIGEGKTRGQAALLGIRACANQNACAIHLSTTPIPPFFVYFYLMSQYDENRRISSGGNQPALNSRRVMDMIMPLPPLEEITEITDRVADHISVLDHLDGEIIDCERLAAALRQSILTVAFAGKLVPQDPADEPAAALLDRIRAARTCSSTRSPVRRRRAKAAEGAAL